MVLMDQACTHCYVHYLTLWWFLCIPVFRFYDYALATFAVTTYANANPNPNPNLTLPYNPTLKQKPIFSSKPNYLSLDI